MELVADQPSGVAAHLLARLRHLPKIEPPVAGNGSTQVFALYLFAALIVWNFFNATLIDRCRRWRVLDRSSRRSTSHRKPPCSPTRSPALLQTGIETLVLVAVMIVLGNVSWTFLVFIYVLAMLVLFCVGIGLMASISNAHSETSAT